MSGWMVGLLGVWFSWKNAKQGLVHSQLGLAEPSNREYLENQQGKIFILDRAKNKEIRKYWLNKGKNEIVGLRKIGN